MDGRERMKESGEELYGVLYVWLCGMIVLRVLGRSAGSVLLDTPIDIAGGRGDILGARVPAGNRAIMLYERGLVVAVAGRRSLGVGEEDQRGRRAEISAMVTEQMELALRPAH